MDTNSPAEGTLMGSHDFREVTFTDADMRSAYREVSERAEREDGASAYSGTIATTNGVYQSPLHPIPVREDRIDEDGIQSELDGMDKWGPCAAIPILRVTSSQEEWLGKFASEVTVPSELVNGDRDALISALEKAALKVVAKSARVSGKLTVREYPHLEPKRVTVGTDPEAVRCLLFEAFDRSGSESDNGRYEGKDRDPIFRDGRRRNSDARMGERSRIPVRGTSQPPTRTACG